MSRVNPPGDRLSTLAYHDYVAMLTFMEEPLAVRLRQPATQAGLGIHAGIRRRFTRSCGRYRQRVSDHAEAYRRANADRAPLPDPVRRLTIPPCGTPGERPALANPGQTKLHRDWGIGLPAGPAGLAPYLYNPAHWVAFGRIDAISVVLFDDFDPMISLMAEAKSPINQATLTFCPRLSDADLGLGPKYGPNPFVPLHKLLDGPPPTWANSYAAADHSFQKAAPLLTVSRFKLGGLGVLAGGVAVQHAAVRAMAAVIHRELHAMRQRLGDARSAALELSAADLDATRCVLLDSQGPEDLVLLVAGSNYSVGVALVGRLRCLTLADLYAAAPDLEGLLDRRSPDLLGRLAVPPAPGQGAAAWKDNHVFNDSYTHLGATAAAIRRPAEKTVRGRVRVVAQVDGNPGHLTQVRELLRAAEIRAGVSGETVPALAPAADLHHFLVGRHDLLTEVGQHDLQADAGGPAGGRFITTRQFFEYLGQVVAGIRGWQPPAAGPGDETGLMDFSSSIVVPFALEVPAVGPRHQPLMRVLEDLRRRLTRPGGPPAFDLARLQAATRRLRTPWSLCGAIDRLYQTFVNRLADPHLFDSVLDLVDMYAALYSYLTEYLPAVHRQPTGGRAGGMYGGWLTGRLDALLTAIQNAAEHRVRLMLPNTDMRDTAVDLRGGLSKLVAAADVPLKCGLYLAGRATVTADGTPPLSADWPHTRPAGRGNRVAAVTRLTFDPNTTIQMLTAGPSADPWHLAHVSLDIGHVFRPIRFLVHLHEAAHLLQSPAADDGREASPLARAMAAEVFPELLTLFMVFGTDTRLYLRRFVAGYGTSPDGQGSSEPGWDTDAKARRRLLPRLFLVFLVTHPVRRYVNEGHVDPADWSPDRLGDLLAEAGAEDAFLELVREVRPFYERFDALWGGDRAAADADCRDYFRRAVADCRDLVAGVWGDALQRYQATVSQDRRDGPIRWLERTVTAALRGGRPLSHLRAAGRPDGLRPMEVARLVCRLLYSHTSFCYNYLDPRAGLHLCRSQETGRVDYTSVPAGASGWNVFQLDATHDGLFCADPVVRRQRILREVVILKSLWDISTHLRAERLANLSHDATG